METDRDVDGLKDEMTEVILERLLQEKKSK